MPLNYLDNDDSMSALRNMGRSFSDAVIGMSQRQLQQRQLEQKSQMNQQMLAIAQARERREGDRSGMMNDRDQSVINANQSKVDTANEATTRQERATRLKSQSQLPREALMQMVQDPKSGPQMMGDLRAVGAAPDGEFQVTPEQLMQKLAMALGGQTYGIASGSPSSAARLAAPLIMGPNHTAFDPFTGQPSASTGPAEVSPYQAQALRMRQQHYVDIAQNYLGRLSEQQRHNQVVEDTTQQRYGRSADATDTKLLETGRHNKAIESKTKGDKYGIQQKLAAATGTQSPTNASIPTFSTEEAARAAGHKTNAVVRIIGVGKVQLD